MDRILEIKNIFLDRKMGKVARPKNPHNWKSTYVRSIDTGMQIDFPQYSTKLFETNVEFMPYNWIKNF